MRHIVLCTITALALLAPGCGYNPNFKAGVSGLGNLPEQRPGGPPLPDAADLPKITDLEARPSYRIGPLDQITVVIWGRPDLGSQVPSEKESQRSITTVAADGTITLPFLPRLEVAGLTVGEAAELIKDGYARSVTTPQVEVAMVAYRSKSVHVEGEVERPGIVPLTDTVMTLGEVLALAGPTTSAADTRNALMIRDDVSYLLDDWAARRGRNEVMQLLMEDGDRIYYPSADEQVFYVLGDVINQGAFPIPDKGMTLLEGLALAGGPNLESAKLRPITLIRLHGDDSTVYEFDLADAMEATDVPLFPGDRIYIQRAGLWYFGNFWKQMVPFISLASAAWFIDRLLEE